ncbi:hypothetical protein D9M68_435650 [compost metagenome]
MSTRPLFACLTALLLAACASEPMPPPAATPKPAPAPAVAAEPELPAHLRELRGSLRTPPVGSEVEMALLVVDERGRPQRLLASTQLRGDGQALPFRLAFNPESFPQAARVELRARVSQSGRLILRLPPQRIFQAQSQSLGELPLVNAP